MIKFNHFKRKARNAIYYVIILRVEMLSSILYVKKSGFREGWEIYVDWV